MGIHTTADKLNTGDLFITKNWQPDRLMRATNIRTVRSSETYTVVEYETVPHDRIGQLDLRYDIEVMTLEPVYDIDAVFNLAADGDCLRFWIVGTELWA